mmetsp:Transcript_54387/g.99574  ORF Transcript_54387/g.99574 Transcript_54387/m.99574 type:complete len:349 (-) Transcript_54387:124-1170(-)
MSNGSNTTTNSSLPVTDTVISKVQGVEAATDHVLAHIEHIVLIVGALALLAILFLLRKPIGRTLKPIFAEKAKHFHPRNIKRCLVRCCCGCCGKNNGFQQLAQASHTLGVTVVGIKDIKKRMNLYVEVWTEPQESASRITRTQFQVSGECSFNSERIELDWFGDESWVVVQVVEYPAVGKEKPLGEMRLNKSAVVKYAQESASDPHSPTAGARLLEVKKLDDWMVKIRRRRAQHFAPSNVLMSWGMTKAQDKLGIGVAVGEQEAFELQQENKQLKAQMAMLMSTGGKGDVDSKPPNMDDVEAVMAYQPVIMNIVLKFDLQPRQAANAFNSSMFKTSSFHETQVGTGFH